MSRVRSRVLSDGGAIGDVVRCYMDITASQGSCLTPTYGANALSSYAYRDLITETTTDEVTPGFQKRINNGEIINSPFTRIKETTEFLPVTGFSHSYKYVDHGTCSGVLYDKIYRIYGSYSVPSVNIPAFLSDSVVPVSPGSISSLAVTEAFSRVDASEILALATAAEGRKTIESMASIFLRLFRIVKALKKLDAKVLRKEISAKEIANRYMELRYAIRPLIYDVQGIGRALNTRHEHVRRTARGSQSAAGQYQDTVENQPHSWLARCDWKREANLSVSCRAGVLYSVNIDTVSVYGLDQAVETMWELTPFSFIIDWFLNVGNTIAAWTPNAGVTQLASWVTTKSHFVAVNTITAVRHDTSSATSIGISGGMGTKRYIRDELTRAVNPQLGVWPSVQVRLDGYKLTDIGIIISKYLR